MAFNRSLQIITNLCLSLQPPDHFHHAEEALIEVDDLDTSIRQAKHDFMAIQGSALKNKTDLLYNIRRAIKTLRPEDLPYFELPRVEKSDDQASGDKQGARAVLREVRSTLNQFRDRRWEGLVRQRSQLLTTIGVTGLVAQALLSTIILAHPLGIKHPPFEDVQQLERYFCFNKSTSQAVTLGKDVRSVLLRSIRDSSADTHSAKCLQTSYYNPKS